MRLFFLLLITFCRLNATFASTLIDSTRGQNFRALADKMRLKTPRLMKGEYEVRIWKKEQLRHGDAHVLYILEKKEETFTASKYIINSNQRGFTYAVRTEPTLPVGVDLWERLMQQDILTLADELSIQNQLHPRNQNDSTWNVIEPDGSVSVHAKKKVASVWISDGESYYVEVSSHDNHRIYGYSNPQGYLRAKPEIVELRKIVTIIDEITETFRVVKQVD